MLNLILRPLIWLIELTIVVGLTGGLVDLTRSMGKEAIKAGTQQPCAGEHGHGNHPTDVSGIHSRP